MSHFLGIEVSPDIIRAACAGDARAYEAIYRSCQRPVYTLIRRLVQRPAIAEELLQETYVEILRNIRSCYTGDGAFGGWVRAIAVNKYLMYLRSPWQRGLTWLDAGDCESGPVVLPDGRSGPDAQAQANADVGRALSVLPPLTRSVVWLHDVEGYTHAEIARLLGRTTSFSKSQLARAHQRLRELLDAPAEPLPCTQVSIIC